MNEHRLCYVKDDWAYFTSIPLSEQWGDDWGDTPYQCNAGRPYEDTPGQIIRIAFLGPHEDAGWHLSVEKINSQGLPWLRYNDSTFLLPDCTINEFKDFIWKTGGEVYTKENPE